MSPGAFGCGHGMWEAEGRALGAAARRQIGAQSAQLGCLERSRSRNLRTAIAPSPAGVECGTVFTLSVSVNTVYYTKFFSLFEYSKYVFTI